MGIGVSELLVILVIVVLLFGTKKLRNVGADLGDAIRSFRSAVKDGENSVTKHTEKDETPADNEKV